MQQIKITKSVTARTKTVDDYLKDISSIPMISPEEESELAARIQAGDKDALKRLVEANLRFSVSVAKQYQNRGLELADLINEGNMGLIKAASRFDPTRGFKFISYGVWWIRQNIMQAISDQGRMARAILRKTVRTEPAEMVVAGDSEAIQARTGIWRNCGTKTNWRLN